MLYMGGISILHKLGFSEISPPPLLLPSNLQILNLILVYLLIIIFIMIVFRFVAKTKNKIKMLVFTV